MSVTCCPYCDQKVSPGSTPPGQCFVCRQPLPAGTGTGYTGAKKRLAFEIEQLEGEDAELEELLERLRREQEQVRGRLRRLDQELAEVETLLRPIRAAVAAVLPPEISVIDTKVGGLEERVAQLLRLRRAVEQRDELSAEIDRLRAEVQGLSDDVDAESSTIPFEKLSDVISDGFNEYLNFLNAGHSQRWQQPAVGFELGDRHFRLRVGKGSWTSLGATSICYLMLAYHHALLKLSRQEGYNYPGLALIDFPPVLADRTTIADKENYLIEPFVALFEAKRSFQLIVCGRAFENLKGVHRLHLTTVWTQEQAGEPDAPVEAPGLFLDEE